MTGRLYQLEGRDTSGVFLGMTVAECVLLGAGFLGTIALRLVGVPVVISALPLVVGAGLAKVHVVGRPLHQWLPLLTGWASAGVSDRRRWRGPLPLLPTDDDGTPRGLPPVLSGLDIIKIPTGDGSVAVVRDKRAARLTAVVPVQAGRFAGADPATQDTLLAGWGNVLAAYAAARSPVIQVGWSHQATAATLANHRDWLATQARTGRDNVSGYEDLLDDLTEIATSHETVVWVTVSGRQAPGTGRLVTKAAASLPGVLDTLDASLNDAGLEASAPLTVPELWRLLRHRSDPHTESSGSPPSLAERMGLAGAHTGPLAMDTTWSELRIDGTWHRVYWVETWPRRPVPADWLTGFLLTDSATMTVICRPVDPARSHRRIDSQLVKLSAHLSRKDEKGRRITEADQRTEDAVHELEADLASGHAEMLYLGLVCVSAPSQDELEERCHTITQTARATQMSLRLLHGRQDTAWAATLPYGLTDPSGLELAGL